MSDPITLNITGMKCGGCVSAVTDALKAVNKVESVDVSLEEKRAVVHGEADIDQLMTAVDAAGFTAERG